MNYQKIYNEIIYNRLINKIVEGYTEQHHILPKSLGGTDNQNNIVKLTAREHFICHLLLTKMYKEGTTEWIKMFKAFHLMMVYHSTTQKRYINSHFYNYLKSNYSKAQAINQKGIRNSQFGKRWVINPISNEIRKINESELEN